MSTDPSDLGPQLPGDFWSARRWLGRLSMSFFIVAAFLALHVRRLYLLPGGADRLQLTIEIIGAMVCVVLGVLGLRERHRRHDRD